MMSTTFELREVDCQKCGKTGLTAYGQCRDPDCGQNHRVRIIR